MTTNEKIEDYLGRIDRRIKTLREIRDNHESLSPAYIEGKVEGLIDAMGYLRKLLEPDK